MNQIEQKVIEYAENPRGTAALVLKLEIETNKQYMNWLGFRQEKGYWILKREDAQAATERIKNPKAPDYSLHWQNEAPRRWREVVRIWTEKNARR